MSSLPPLIRGVEYDAATKALTVRFQVGAYVYAGVPADKALALEIEHSQQPYSTRYFDAQIEGKYPSKAVS